MLGKGWFPAEVGGLDRYYRGLLESLQSPTGVVLGPGPDAPENVTLVATHSSPLPWRLFRFTKAAVRSGWDVEIVDVHFVLYGVLPALLAPIRHKPLVVHFQGPWADESVAAGERSGWRIRAKRTMEKLLYRRADAAITLTSAFKELLVDQYGIAPARVHVLRPGIDTNTFRVGDARKARRRFDIPDHAFVVCCARRLVPRMGIDVLLDAWQDGLGQDPDAYLLIAGSGPIEDQLRQSTHGTSWGERIRFLGRLDEPDLLALYQSANVNVLPSLAFEGFGLTVLETAACGTPSIVTDVGGLPEAVEGLGENLVVRSGSAKALSDRLVTARAGDLPTRSHTSAWGARHAWPEVAAEHVRLYASLQTPRTD